MPSHLRLAGWSGIAFVALSGVIVVVSPFWPPLGASAPDITAYYAAHRSAFLWGNYLAIVAVLPSFIQLAALVRLFQRAEGDSGWWWLCVLSSALVAHALGGLALTVYQAVPFAVDTPASAKALSDLAGVAFALSLLGLGAYAFFTSIAARVTKTLPSAFAAVGYLVTAVCLFGSLGSVWAEPSWLAGGGLLSAAAAGLFFGWCLWLSVLFLRLPLKAAAA